MAKLYMKQKVFSFRNRFSIKNEEGEEVYRIESRLFSFGKYFTMYDSLDREIAVIQRELFQKPPRFMFIIDGVEVAEIAKVFSFFKPRFIVNGIGWDVVGDFFGHNYKIMDRDDCIALIHKAFIDFGDSFEIDMLDGVDERAILAIALAIDCVMGR